MQIDITGLSEAEAQRMMRRLDNAGYEYDRDYEALYSGAYIISGVRIGSAWAARVALAPSNIAVKRGGGDVLQ